MTRHRPVPLLLGLLVGTLTLALSAGYYWPLAAVFPLVLVAVTVPPKRTRTFGLGALAAACGAVVAVLTLWVLLAL